jgi:hypothetical protein
MATKSFVEAYKSNMFANWGDVTKVSKPVRCGAVSCANAVG